MHIPDSAVSPVTSIVAGIAMLPIWHVAARRVRETLSTREVPLLALGAAFCFTVMMLNIPVPGGTTVHATGAVLLAVLLGPWAAVAGVTVTLAIQALLFADGGVLAIGANALAMAFAMPFAGFATYRVAAAGSAPDSRRRALAAGIGAYAGLNAAALVTATILGIQPGLFHDATGRALYFPFGLAVTVPAMMAAHLTVAGAGEAALTFFGVRYLQSAGIPLAIRGRDGASAGRRRLDRLGVALGVLVALTPLGLLARGGAWGEWGIDETAARAGYLPAGLAAAERRAGEALAPLRGYLADRGALGYLVAGAAGALVVGGLLYSLGRIVARGRRDAAGRGPSSHPASFASPSAIPDWLRAGTGAEPIGSSERRRRARWAAADFAERTLSAIAHAARTSLVSETWARRDGLLQRLDSRAKVAALLGFVVVVSFVREAAVLAALLALATALAFASRIPALAFHRRVWLSVPLAVGAVTLPAALDAVTPGAPLLVLVRDPYVAVTRPGLLLAGTLTLRVAVAIAFVSLLALTTPWADLMRGLRAVLVPRPFVAVLMLSYRYVAVLAHAAAEMFVARTSRTVGRLSAASGREFVGGAAGALLGRTLALSGEVHDAMLARGWSGEARSLSRLRLRTADGVWLVSMALAALLAVTWVLLA